MKLKENLRGLSAEQYGYKGKSTLDALERVMKLANRANSDKKKETTSHF